MALKYRAPRGTYDLTYPASEKFAAVVDAACEVMALYGYERIVTPLIESTELFERSIGASTDIVTKEMYSFEDRGGEWLTLRPEGTAPVCALSWSRGWPRAGFLRSSTTPGRCSGARGRRPGATGSSSR